MIDSSGIPELSEQTPEFLATSLSVAVAGLKAELVPIGFDEGRLQAACERVEGLVSPLMWLGYVTEADGYALLAGACDGAAVTAHRNQAGGAGAVFEGRSVAYAALAADTDTVTPTDTAAMNAMKAKGAVATA